MSCNPHFGFNRALKVCLVAQVVQDGYSLYLGCQFSVKLQCVLAQVGLPKTVNRKVSLSDGLTALPEDINWFSLKH